MIVYAVVAIETQTRTPDAAEEAVLKLRETLGDSLAVRVAVGVGDGQHYINPVVVAAELIAPASVESFVADGEVDSELEAAITAARGTATA